MHFFLLHGCQEHNVINLRRTRETSVQIASLFACGEYIVLGTFSTGGEETFALRVYGLVMKVCTRELMKWL